MKQIIMNVLDDMSESQINLASETARETVSSLISAALKTKGIYTEYGDDEIEEQKARETWVCSICGENTADVDYDYIGSGTNHLGCEMKSWDEIKAFGGDTGTDADFNIPASEEVDGMYFDDEVKGWEEAVGYKEPDGEPVRILDDGGGITYRDDFPQIEELEDGVTSTNDDNDDIPEGLKRAKELSQEAIKEGIQKQAYLEMTSDGLPEGGDAQAVLESHKLAEEIVEAQEGTWIYESPDGGKTVFRRPFADYDPKNKEEIDFKTKEPTGRKFTEYNNGNWRSKDEG